MSLTSLHGVLPSTIKKLLAGELPRHRSAHIAEAVAAGCGYPNNAAYLTDLRTSKPVTFLAANRIDSETVSMRLATNTIFREVSIAL